MQSVICQECANGCNLLIDRSDDGLIKVSGNQCEKGMAFARLFVKKTAAPGAKVPRILAAQGHPRYSDKILSDILRFWGVVFKMKHPGVMIQGSPERTVSRMVVEDERGGKFILEQIARRDLEWKKKIIQTLDFLHRQNLSRVRPYLVGPGGQALHEYGEDFWQLMAFVPGEALNRERYIFERWRGPVLADFLLELRTATRDLPAATADEIFSIKKYIYALVTQLRRHKPEMLDELAPVLNFLEARFMKAHDQFPLAFCHGDYHPLNIVWAADDIRAVIDWEFHGFKPEIYDLSNLLGCLGMEHPSALQGELVKALIFRMRETKVVDDNSWHFLIEFIVALRFAWLSEWLRKSDTEMIDLELVYMKLLIENQDVLVEEWGLSAIVK